MGAMFPSFPSYFPRVHSGTGAAKGVHILLCLTSFPLQPPTTNSWQLFHCAYWMHGEERYSYIMRNPYFF